MAKPETVEPGKVRPAAVAGRFYPRDPVELRDLIQTLLAQVTLEAGSELKSHGGLGEAGETPALL